MPHGSKKSRANAKKKGTANHSKLPSHTAVNGRSIPESRPPTMNMKNLKNFASLQQHREKSNDRNNSAAVDIVYNSLYYRYKTCTDRFISTLKSMVPADIFEFNNVDAIINAAEYIARNDLPVERPMLDDLKNAIRGRKYVSEVKHSGGDNGHQFFTTALEYCSSILLPQLVTFRPESYEAAIKTHSVFFASLDMRDLPSTFSPRPQSVPTRLSLEELISGSDRMNVILFLKTLDELMSHISMQYSNLKDFSAKIHSAMIPSDLVIEQMMEASVATNLAIQQVASLEELFVSDHPHLNTVYRMLACLTFVELVSNLTALVTEKSPVAAKFSENDAIAFLGDVLESSFRNPSDPHNKKASLVEEFLKQWQFSEDGSNSAWTIASKVSVSQFATGVEALARTEVPMFMEQSYVRRMLSGIFGSNYSWLSNFTFIGKNRSITHTIRLLQILSHAIEVQQGRLQIAQRGSMFGPSWSDRGAAATKIQVDMDSLLMEDIMPTLISLCHDGMLSLDLPYQEGPFSAFAHIKRFAKHPEQPITWTLAFTVHAILTAVYEVQSHLSILAKTSRNAFDKYITQLEWAKNIRPKAIPQRPPIWNGNINALLTLRSLIVSPCPRTESEKMLSVWNPFCAGTFLSYVAYYGNLEGGTSLVDCVAQLRMTLHLFNALRKLRSIQPGQIELLDFLFQTFNDCKGIWEGPLPAQGQFQTRWWISFGMNSESAAQMENGLTVNENHRNNGDSNPTLTPIAPEDLSKSFRRICLHDFTGIVDEYNVASSRAKQSPFSPLYDFAERLNDTLDAMDAEEQLLATNLVVLGHYLNEFYIQFFIDMGLMPCVENFIREASQEMKQDRHRFPWCVGSQPWAVCDANLKYQAMSHVFAQLILKPLDAGDMRMASRCANSMDRFFAQIPLERYLWFTPALTDG